MELPEPEITASKKRWVSVLCVVMCVTLSQVVTINEKAFVPVDIITICKIGFFKKSLVIKPNKK